MTSSTEFTSNVSQVLQNLNRIAASTPRYTSDTVTEAWQQVNSVITSTDNAILSQVNHSLSGVYAQGVNAVTSPITHNVINEGNIVNSLIDDIKNAIANAIQPFVDTVTGYWDDITGWLDDIITNIGDLIEGIKQWIGDTISGARDWIIETVTGVYNNVKTWFDGVVGRVSLWVAGVYEGVRDWIVNAVNSARDWIQGTYQNISDWIAGVVSAITSTYETVKQTVEDKIQAIIDWVEVAKQNISQWWNKILNEVSTFISTKVIPAWDAARKGAEGIVGTVRLVWEAISKGNYQGAFDIVDKLFKGIGLPAPVQTIYNIVSTLAYFWETVRLQFAGLEYNAQKDAQISLAKEPLDLGTATQAVYKGLLSQEQFINNASLAGISRGLSEHVVDANRPLPSPGQIQESFLRGEIDLKTHDKLLSQYGLSSSNIELIKELYLIIPNVPDLIRMAVREAFSPDIATKFGQYEDYPKEFTTWGVKQGLSEDWCKRYWAAHWDLPSPQMGFEMLHRGIITNDELKLLLRALDVMPFWRERLIKLSYNPLTRVDVRRMYQAGVLDKTQVKRTYLDLGYDDTKANWLTEFTVRYYTPEDQTEQDTFKTMVRGTYSTAYKKRVISEEEYRQFLLNLKYHPDDVELFIQIDNYTLVAQDKLFDLGDYRKDWQKLVLSAYDRGLIIEGELRTLLGELGYSDMEVTLEINLNDYNRQLALRNIVVEKIHDQYVDYIIDNVQMHTILDQFNFTSDEINRLQEEWDIEKALRTKRPSLSDLKAFFTQGLLTLDEMLNELRGLGYNERYISMYAATLA